MNEVEQFISQINQNPYFAIPLMLWTIIWKGLALWKAAKKEDKIWFVVLLVLNSLGIVEILYYFFFSKKTLKLPLFLKKGLLSKNKK